MHNLAFTLSKQGSHDGAVELLTRAYDGFRQVLGAEHPRTLETGKILKDLMVQSQPPPSKGKSQRQNKRDCVIV
jgi:hypothetical protein